MNQKLKVTVTAISIHPEGVNPIFGEGAIHVRVEDEAAGPFIVLGGEAEECDHSRGSIRIDLDELKLVASEAAKLIAAMPEEKP